MPLANNVAEIDTIDDAKLAWQSFFGRFFSPDVPQEVNVDFSPSMRQFTPRKNNKAKYQHPTILVDRTLHSDDFDDFLNGNTISIPDNVQLNQDDLNRVEQAIHEGHFDDPCLKKADHVFYALWLFKQNKITRQQMSTLLARDQIPEQYPISRTFKILDDQGNFTEEAKELWLPIIVKRAFGGLFTSRHVERLRLLIQAAPKSEQIFYISEADPRVNSPFMYQLGNALAENRSWHQVVFEGSLYDFHMSFGVIEGIQIAISGINGAAANRSKIGKIGIDAIREGVESYYRPTAISMRNSGVEATTKGIHNYDESPMPAVTSHDIFHARLHNTINPEFNMMLNHMCQIISKHTKQKWSKTMWELVDREFHAFQYDNIDLSNPNKAAERFIEMLHRAGKDRTFLFRDMTFNQASDDGFAILWNMVNEKELWQKLYTVNIDALGAPYASQIKTIQAFKLAIGKTPNSSEVLTLKYRFFTSTISQREFQLINGILDALDEKLVTGQEPQLAFGKHTQDGVKNISILKFIDHGKELLIDKDSVKNVKPLLANSRLTDLLGEKNTPLVQQELRQVLPQFKSNHKQNTFSKTLLDHSLANLPSITAKLDFLEACYDEILSSSKYTRRHAKLDKTFAFFKNQLTTSQRKHIILLKTALNDLVSDYKKDHPLLKEELQWCLNNRESNLALCNTKRFYLHKPKESNPTLLKP